MAFIFKNTNVATIQYFAFFGCKVDTLNFEDSKITHINGNGTNYHQGAFMQCKNLRTINFKNCVHFTGITGNSAFESCTNLTSVDFTGCSIMEDFGAFTFMNCSNITTMDLTPCSSLKSIGRGCFQQCSNLVSVDAHGLINLSTLGDSDSNSIVAGIFNQCPALTTLNFSGDTALTKIPRGFAGEDKLLSSIDFSGCTSLVTIAERCFIDCIALTTVNFTSCPINSFENRSFQGCTALATIIDWENIKDTVVTFYEACFKGCTNLNIDLSNMPLLTQFRNGWNGASEANAGCFDGCTNLTTTIENCPNLTQIGGYSFRNCTSLGDIDLHDNTSLTTIGTHAFYKTGSININLNNCTSLSSIDKGAFYGAKVENFTMNDCVALTSIGGYVNNGCWAQSNIKTFSAERCTALTNTGEYGFYTCDQVESINFKDCTALTTIGTSCFHATNKGKTYRFTVDMSGCTSLDTISTNAFYWSKLNTLNLKNTAISIIGPQAFRTCDFIEISTHDFTNVAGTVDFSGSTTLTTLRDKAFAECSTSTSIDLSNCPSLIIIEHECFLNDINVHSLNVDGTNNIKTIEYNAFANVGRSVIPVLKANFVAPLLENLGTSAFSSNFEGCRVIESFDATGAPLTAIGSRAFCRCKYLTTVKFKNCTALTNTCNGGDATFYQCSALTTADFSGCTALTNVQMDTFFECTNVVITGVEDWPVATIGQAAFNRCESQPTLKFTNSALTEVANQAFRGCNACTELELHMSNTAGDAIYHQAFTGLGTSAGGCNVKIYATVPPTVTPIGSAATANTVDGTWRISLGTSNSSTFHFNAAAEADYKAAALALEDAGTVAKGNSSALENNCIAWWCCSNGALSTTTGGTAGDVDAQVTLWYTGSPTIVFDL